MKHKISKFNLNYLIDIFFLLLSLFIFTWLLNIKADAADFSPSMAFCDWIPPLPAHCFESNNLTNTLYLSVNGSGPDYSHFRLGKISNLSNKPWQDSSLYTYDYTFSSGGKKIIYVDYKLDDGSVEQFTFNFTIDNSAPYGYISPNQSFVKDNNHVMFALSFFDYLDDYSNDNVILDGEFKIGKNSNLSDAYYEPIYDGKKVIAEIIDSTIITEGTMGEEIRFYQFRDKFGNESDIKRYEIVIDKMAPEIYAYLLDSEGNIDLSISDHDGVGVSKIYYSKNQTTIHELSGPGLKIIEDPNRIEHINVTPDNPEDFILGIVAEDELGNQSDVYFMVITKDIPEDAKIDVSIAPTISAIPTDTVNPSVSVSPSQHVDLVVSYPIVSYPIVSYPVNDTTDNKLPIIMIATTLVISVSGTLGYLAYRTYKIKGNTPMKDKTLKNDDKKDINLTQNQT